jgi:hypothetical protein
MCGLIRPWSVVNQAICVVYHFINPIRSAASLSSSKLVASTASLKSWGSKKFHADASSHAALQPIAAPTPHGPQSPHAASIHQQAVTPGLTSWACTSRYPAIGTADLLAPYNIRWWQPDHQLAHVYLCNAGAVAIVRGACICNNLAIHCAKSGQV